MRMLLCSMGFVVGLLVSACGGGSESGPPNMRFGEEVCDRCRMIITDERFAAASRATAAEARKYDDIGCLVLDAESASGAARRWVRGYHAEGWLDAGTASFVHSSELLTPMGYGIAALSTAEAADTLARESGGRVLSFGELAAVLNSRLAAPSGDRPELR